MSTKTTYIINPDLFSGSADLFRTSFGGFFITEDEQASFINTTLEIPAEDVFDAVYYEQQQTVADYSNIIPNYTVPVRVASNGENIVTLSVKLVSIFLEYEAIPHLRFHVEIQPIFDI